MFWGYAPYGPGKRTRTSNALRHQGLNLAAIPIRLHPDIATIVVADHTRLYLRETVCLNLVVTPSPLQLSLTNGEGRET